MSTEGKHRQQPSAFLEDVESRVVTATISGREYQISVALPIDYADSTKSYPVLYALDANAQFGMVVETARFLRVADVQIPQLIIVGIGYPVGGRFVGTEALRSYDTTPSRDLEWEELHGRQSGGAPDFLRFIREELFPLIDAEYRTAPDRAIYGHSAGGRFAFYALLAGEGAFQRAIIASPSLWWGDGYLLDLEETYSQANRSLAARVFLARAISEPDRIVTNFDRLIQVLDGRNYEGLEWQHQVFENENHQSVVPSAISRGLRVIYDPPG